MKYGILTIFGIVAFFVIDWAGGQYVSDALGELLGAAVFGIAALVLGALILLPFRSKKSRRRYPTELGELDEYTGFLGHDQ